MKEAIVAKKLYGLWDQQGSGRCWQSGNRVGCRKIAKFLRQFQSVVGWIKLLGWDEWVGEKLEGDEFACLNITVDEWMDVQSQLAKVDEIGGDGMMLVNYWFEFSLSQREQAVHCYIKPGNSIIVMRWLSTVATATRWREWQKEADDDRRRLFARYWVSIIIEL